MSNSLQWMATFYGVLIRLYPRQFKREFADELLSVFIALAQDAASSGFLALTVFCLRELRDFPINLFRAHLENNPMTKIFDSDSWRFMLRGVFAFVALLVTYNVVFFLLVTNGSGMLFIPTILLDYYYGLILLLGCAIASAMAGTVFAIILGERPRIRWSATLVVAVLLPRVVALVAFGSNNGDVKDSVEIRIAAMVLFALNCGLLLFMLLREQPRFHWLMLAILTVWLPQVLTSEVFQLTPIVGVSEAQMQFQRILLNLAMGVCLAGVFGMLLQNSGKLLLFMMAGGLLYVLVDSVFSQQIYFWLIPMLSPLVNFSTTDTFTMEQFALLSGIVSASLGLLFGLPLILIFIWLRRWKSPAALQPSA